MQFNLKDINFGQLEKPIVEYIKTGKRKSGVFVAGIHPDYKNVVIGFALCSKLDKFDWVKTGKGKEKIPGFGKDLATKRAVKWENYENLKFGNKREVILPESIIKDLSAFIFRCKAYYKDKNLTDWVLSNREVG